MTTSTTRLSAAILFFALFTLPGCIVWDIRDEMKNVNGQLTEVRAGLTKLDDTNHRLDQTIANLERTNALVESVEKQLAVLNTINTSLSRLDQHLAALRRTLGKLDSVIPFLDLGTEPVADEPPVATAPPTTPATPNTNPPTPDALSEPAQATSKAPARDSLVGIWTSRWPDSEIALVILEDNTFIFTTAAREDAGTWKRDGKKISLKNSQPEKRLNAQGKPEDGPPRERVLEIISSAGRSMAAKVDGKTIIFARP